LSSQAPALIVSLYITPDAGSGIFSPAFPVKVDVPWLRSRLLGFHGRDLTVQKGTAAMNTRPVHPIVEYAHDTFGDGFASVILHGIREAEGATVECLSIDGTYETWERINKKLLVRQPQSEKWGYRPLVLAVLLKLLLSQPKIEPVLNFSFTEVLRDLIWPDSSATRREVEDAIGFYFRCSYSRRNVPADDANLYGMEGVYRLITGYGSEGAIRSQNDLFIGEGYEVSFDETLVEALRQDRIVFANIFFGNLMDRIDKSFPGAFADEDKVRQRTPETDYRKEDAQTKQPYHPPGPRPTVRIEANPVSRRSADLRPKLCARPVGQSDISIDTGAIASVVLRALHYTAARHPVEHEPSYESGESIADSVYQEVDLHLKRATFSMVKQMRRCVFEQALQNSYGLMHIKEPIRPSGEHGPRTIWHTPDHLISALMRAIEAIEFNEWKPKKQRVRLNIRWDINKTRVATIKLVATYWAEAEGIDVGIVDSSQMGKWLTSFGLPSFSILRSELRLKIIKARSIQMKLQAKENIWSYLILSNFFSTIN
jgi:hypothetical protein